MYPQFRFIRRALYNLKRQYPLPIMLCSTVTSTDLETGLQSEILTKYSITKAIVMPTRETREILSSLKTIAPYNQGSTIDSRYRRIIIDLRDLPPTHIVTLNDFIIFNAKRYELKQVQEFEHQEAIILYIDMTQGAPVNDTISLAVADIITPQDGATYVIQ